MKQKTPRSQKTSKKPSSSRSENTRNSVGKSVLSPEVLSSNGSGEPEQELLEGVEPDTDDLELEDSIEEPDISDLVDLEDPPETDLDLRPPSSSGQLTPHGESGDGNTEAGPSTKAISTHDPLRRYLEEVRRYPLLNPDEEFALAVKLRDTGDLKAAKTLVSANLRLVVKISFEYRNFYSNLLDLIQEGNIGLMKAVSKFDPTKGARLGYYASWWIRSYILKYLLDNFRLVKVGTTQAQKKLFYHLMREKERMEAQGLLAGPKLLAEKLNVREKDVVEMEQRLSGKGVEMSLDTPIDRDPSGKTTSYLDSLEDQSSSADDRLVQNQLIQLLQDSLPRFQETLNDKERRILQDRLLSDEPKTLQEVADLYGLTRERARQIETKVIEKLREFLKDSF